jgi:copper chaperone CopZ
MFRRNFLKRIAAAGAGGAATMTAAASGERRTVTYRVKGFSCVTCAVGLETMLGQKRGVIHVEASYPNATAVVEYDSSLVAEEQLRAFISEMGFTAEKAGAHGQA